MEDRDVRLDEDRSFVISKKHNNNLYPLLKEYPRGIPDRIICRSLQISKEELETIYKRAILSLKEKLVGDDSK